MVYNDKQQQFNNDLCQLIKYFGHSGLQARLLFSYFTFSIHNFLYVSKLILSVF